MKINELLESWYKKEQRDLPWRNTSDPYKIWISEVILQQTRVNQGIDYYEKFISIFPDIKSLAQADIDKVLKVWQGLGYYTRAMNLHESAKHIMSKLSGKFPGQYKDLLKLKGLGPYSAAAIASIVFHEPVAAVDGNVKRVISRLFSVEDDIRSLKGLKKINKYAELILDRTNPGLHNQAIIDLGAIICLPKNPKCQSCPLNIVCEAFKDNRVFELPVKYTVKKIKERYLIYLIIKSENDEVVIQKRRNKDIWAGLYEFPLCEVPSKPEIIDLPAIICEKFNIRPDSLIITKISEEITRVLSHQRISARFVHVKNYNYFFKTSDEQSFININNFPDYPVSRLIDLYISREGF